MALAVVAAVLPGRAGLADGPSRDRGKVSVEMSLVEPSGATLADRTVTVAVGGHESVIVQEREGRTIAIDASISGGAKTGCFKIALIVRDRRIDTSGHFSKTVWQSATEPCDPQPITLGPKDETRIRVSVRPAN